jgi:hypothetical protein
MELNESLHNFGMVLAILAVYVLAEILALWPESGQRLR